ncbi:S8 family serine peptidase [Streptomyces sp. NPDC057694]|uniref:S8 family serine peptidase n=1 Tax=Streptomyces sp. NPDC057694 TaxID=3346216 RepID=UPI0036A70003
MHATRAVTATALLLSTAFPAAASPSYARTDGHEVTRIVTLTGSPAELQVPSSRRRAAGVTLAADQDRFLTDARQAGIAVTVSRRFRQLVNGLTVRVPSSQAGRLGSLAGVASVSVPARYDAPESPTPVGARALRAATAGAAGARSAGTPLGRETVTATDLTGVPEAHRSGATGKGVTVGIIDSGIAYDHPALGGGGFPNSKVVGGYDFADGDADPYDDSSGSAVGHGTHVAGIIAGDDDHILGVAPDARLRSYRVFGASGGAGEDVLLAALDRAAADGVDVVNMSLGSPTGARAGGVLASAVDRLVASGTAVTVAEGNGYAGPFNTAEPAIADGAMGVGSTYSDRSPYLAMALDGDNSPVAYSLSGRGPRTPATGAADWADVRTGCDPLPPNSLRGKIALFTPGTSTADTVCRPMDVARRIADAGAVAAVQHNSTLPDTVVPIAPCCGTSTIPVLGISERDARRVLASAPDAELHWGAYAGTELAADTSGLMDLGSSWGPGNELGFKPDFAAPGGFILSAMPKELDWYGVSSGTSMASPHVAGATALLLQKHPGLSPAQVQSALQNTAMPLGRTGGPQRGLEPVAHQGAGRIDVAAALAATARVSPSELALHDLEGRPTARRLTVRNDTNRPQTYKLTHRAALSAAPPYTSEWQEEQRSARVTLPGARSITVPAHGARTVTVVVREPAGVTPGTLFGGWIEFTPQGANGQPLRVPYQGLAGDYDAVSAINPTFTAINTTLDNPALRPAAGDFGKNLPVTIDLGDDDLGNDTAAVMLSHGFPLLDRLRMQVLDARGRVVATPYDRAYVTRNSGAGTGVGFSAWNATLDDGSPAPAGVYRLRLVFDKALGDRDHAPPTQLWTSPDVTVIR